MLMSTTALPAARLCVLLLLAAATIDGAGQTAPAVRPLPPDRVRLYVLDCGMINSSRAGTERYKVTPEEVAETRLVVPCYLVSHPMGTLMWDFGIVQDAAIEARARGEQAATPAPAVAVATRTLRGQLAEIGYRPEDVTFAALSHAHGDHTANANMFAAATWLARPAEWAFMWEAGNTRVTRASYSAIEQAKRISLDRDEHDVFGDGRVILKAAAGHSPGHQVLALNLATTGRVVLAGDIYHYPEERLLRRPPPDTEFSVSQAAAARVAVEEYARRTNADLWIEHDFVAHAKRKKSPAYYD